MVPANPFTAKDKDAAQLWEVLVARDIEAFVACDWQLHARDIHAPAFCGINANGSADPASWTLEFADLATYGQTWLRFARESAARSAPELLKREHHKASTLREVQVGGEVATCLKSFNGAFEHDDGTPEVLHWETLYTCRRIGQDWKIWSFVGFLPGFDPTPAPPRAR